MIIYSAYLDASLIFLLLLCREETCYAIGGSHVCNGIGSIKIVEWKITHLAIT